MLKIFIPLLALVALAIACHLPATNPASPPPSATTSLSPTIPSPSDTPTPLPSATPTPTPLPVARIREADHAMFNGDWETALAAYQSALGSSTDSDLQTAALLGIGKIYLQTGELAGALRELRQLVDGYPDSPHRSEAFFVLGRVYQGLSRHAEAAEAYLGYLSLRPGFIDAYMFEQRGDALFAAGDYANALRDYQAALNSPRLEAAYSLEIKMARSYAIIGEYATALVMYADIYQRTGNDFTKAQVNLLSGQIYARLGQWDQAYAAYLDSVENYPMAYDSYLALVELVNAGYPVNELDRGFVDYYAREYGVAVAAFDRYLATAPANPATALYYKGLSLRALTNHYGAIEQWDRLIQEYPGSSLWDDAWEQKAYTQWAFLGLYTEAEQTLRNFVASVPNHARAAEFLFNAARIAERGGSLETAAVLWDRVALEYPTSGNAYQALFLAGITHYRLENAASSQAVFLRSLAFASSASERAAASLWVGKTYQALGDEATARKTWEDTAMMDPMGYYSERARDLLLERAPFTQPETYNLGVDHRAERAKAEEWLKTTINLPPETDLSGPGELSNDARFIRGGEYWRLGLFTQAQVEFDALRVSLQNDPVANYRLANHLVELGFYRPAVFAARQVLNLAGMNDVTSLSAPAYFNHIRFGTFFADLVIPTAQSYGFHPLLAWSLIRQESLFDQGIRSSAGAQGLMQIIPTTGQEIVGRLGWPPNYTTSDLNRPVVSIRLGMEYLYRQREYFQGDLYAALAAYNGGPGNTIQWRNLESSDPDLFLEVIRLDEPRRYIMRIYENFNIYRRLYTLTP